MTPFSLRTAAVILLAGCLAAGTAAAPRSKNAKRMSYPATRVSDAKDTLHGVTVPDPYRWLEDAKAPEVQEWMAAQDKVARQYLNVLPGRAALAERLRDLLYYDAVSAPVYRGTRYFYTRRHADREKAIAYWKEGQDGEERVLLDPNKLSEDGSVSLGTWVPSWDGRRVVYGLRENNADEATLYVMEVDSGEVSKVDRIEGGKYARPYWTRDNAGFYYTYLPNPPGVSVADRPGYAEVRYHKLGTDPAADPVVHARTGSARTFIAPVLSWDGRWLFVYLREGWNRSDVYYRDLQSADPAFKPFVKEVPALFTVTAWKDHFYIQTDHESPKGRLFRTRADAPGREHWQEIVPEAKDAVLDSFNLVGDRLVLNYLKNASTELQVRELDGTPVRTVPLPGIGTSGGMSGNPDEDEAYFSFTSFTRPAEIYRTSVKTGETKLWAAVKLPVDSSPYTAEQVWYPSKDGTKVSMFIVRRKDMPRDGSTPFLLGGYGGFNVSMTPSFASSLYPWLEAGGGYAVPNLRGGGEYGEDWHKAGMLDKKQNVFDDYIAAAEYLVRHGYTKPERLGIRGGSNGGLLVGAALTQRPDLFRAVLCAVPLLDMVRYHLFGSGRTWIPEYGTAEDPRQFKTLLGYSPYHRVKKGTRYPAVLMQSADSDDRVDPMHARKMTALLQAANKGPHPVLLRIEKNAGHGGADLVKQQVESSADSYAFFMHELGMKPYTRAK